MFDNEGLDYIDNKTYINNMARIVIDNVPEEIRAGFKAICALNRTNMRDHLLKYLTQLVNERINRDKGKLEIKTKRSFCYDSKRKGKDVG